MRHMVYKTIFLYLDHSSFYLNARKDMHELLYITEYYIHFSFFLFRFSEIQFTYFLVCTFRTYIIGKYILSEKVIYLFQFFEN